ncbi:outer membrane protein assembly factor BamB [Vibrio salinus]|uniref:outer membrane protein assembly factor BamB n=1 Tax=Vibrio salinus TaxID=2899784 RepID=UPI001E5392ED|nr:outer membrane protein assembly factor BamB [Vibrio salinus]MCE0493169.1 outer membrane protein assembly factor BamB [Vibrio salinus]
MRKLFQFKNQYWLAIALISGFMMGCSSEEDSIVMAPVPEVNSQFTPAVDWSESVGSGVGHFFSKLKPAYAYDKIFVASRNGLVKALDPKTGKTLWSKELEGEKAVKLAGGIAAGLNKVFIGSETGLVYALDAVNGKLLWTANVSGEVLATPTTDGSFVIVNTSEGELVGLDQQDGKQKWVINTEVPNLTLRGDSSPVAVSGGVFWGTASGRLAAAISSRGQLIWQQSVGIPKGSTEIDRLVDVDSSPLVIGATLFTVGYNGQLIAIDLRSGKPKWKRVYSSALDLASDGASIFLVTSKDHVVSVDARSGTELWKNTKLENRLLTSPVIIDNYVVVGDNEGYLYWIDRNTGEFVSRQYVNGSGFAVAPIVLPDGYLIVTRNGDVKKLTIK